MRKTHWYWNNEEDRPIDETEWKEMRRMNAERCRKRAKKTNPSPNNTFWETIATAWEESK